MSWNPLKVAFPTGPNCDGCPFRKTSMGFAVTQGYKYDYDMGGIWLTYEPGALFASADYMFILEALGKDEAKQGMNLVGGTGGIFNYLLHNHTPLKRPNVVIANTVRCRPIKFMQKGNELHPIRQSNGDFVNDKPDPAQVKECYERYGKRELEAFKGHTIMLLGSSSLALFAGRGRAMEQTVGHIFEHGSMLPCVRCNSTGLIASPRKNCPVCAKRGTAKCPECGRWAKHLKRCISSGPIEEKCSECGGQGSIPRPPKLCPDCKGNKELPSDPGNTYTSKLLKEGQIALPTYHPAFLMRQPNKKKLVARHFERLTDLRGELEVDKNTKYLEYPITEETNEVFNSPVGIKVDPILANDKRVFICLRALEKFISLP